MVSCVVHNLILDDILDEILCKCRPYLSRETLSDRIPGYFIFYSSNLSSGVRGLFRNMW